MKIVLFLLTLLIFGLLLSMVSIPQISEDTIRECRIDAQNAYDKLSDEDEFKDWNYFRTCLMNTSCNSPISECPMKQIGELSDNWRAE